MSNIKKLVQSYRSFIALPRKNDTPLSQRTIFCVYNPHDELLLRAKFDDFEIASLAENHEWTLFDLSDSFARWLPLQRFAESYFKKPHLIPPLFPLFLSFITKEFTDFLQREKAGENTVTALSGVGSLFGFLKVNEVVDQLAPLVPGRLLVFFPGAYKNETYRLLDANDGWNYPAVPITGDENF